MELIVGTRVPQGIVVLSIKCDGWAWSCRNDKPKERKMSDWVAKWFGTSVDWRRLRWRQHNFVDWISESRLCDIAQSARSVVNRKGKFSIFALQNVISSSRCWFLQKLFATNNTLESTLKRNFSPSAEWKRFKSFRLREACDVLWLFERIQRSFRHRLHCSPRFFLRRFGWVCCKATREDLKAI